MIKRFGPGVRGYAAYVQRRSESQIISGPLVDDRSGHASVDPQSEIFSDRQEFDHVLFAVGDHFEAEQRQTKKHAYTHDC